MPNKKNILFNKVLETTWVFFIIIGAVKLCLVYSLKYLSTSVASIKREPFYDNFPNMGNQLFKLNFWDFDAVDTLQNGMKRKTKF